MARQREQQRRHQLQLRRSGPVTLTRRRRQFLGRRDPSPGGSRQAHWGRHLRRVVLRRSEEEEGWLCCRCCYAEAGAGAEPVPEERGTRRACRCSEAEAEKCSAVGVGAAAGSSADVGAGQAEGSSEGEGRSAAVIVAGEGRDSSAGAGAVVVEEKGSVVAVVVVVVVIAGGEAGVMRSRDQLPVVRDKTEAGWQEVRSVGGGSCWPALSTQEELSWFTIVSIYCDRGAGRRGGEEAGERLTGIVLARHVGDLCEATLSVVVAAGVSSSSNKSTIEARGKVDEITERERLEARSLAG